ncbi:arylmalonate decarboxylase [Streptacidiphilus sp. N1-12]|uniref:Arylmalonate decarboxylase n=2 Tax=Streptacidiphilus alkalitolerans TaxID=3342712 RepID=A0ABV6V4N6_9ACTN
MEMYNVVLPDILATFGALRLDAAVVACNASHYILDPDGDRAFLDRLSERFGFPVQSSTQAIVALCEALEVRRLILVSPYAPWLTEASRGYWEKAGLTVDQIVLAPGTVDGAEVDDLFNPYLVTTATLLDRVGQVRVPEDGALLFTGTGMGTLPAMAELARAGSRRILLTSNLASAWWVRRTVKSDSAPTHPLVRRVQQQVADLRR